MVREPMDTQDPAYQSPNEADDGSRQRRRPMIVGEISGAFADLGTVLPLTLGMLALGDLDPTGVLLGFGVFALATAAIYRRPVPVQPMKAVAAIALATGLSGDAILASGILVGALLVAFALSGGLEWVARFVPQSVLAGLQFGIGLQLVWFGLGLMSGHAVAGVAFIGFLLVLLRTAAGPFAAIALLAIGTVWELALGEAAMPDLAIGFHLPHFSMPGQDAFAVALTDVVPGQVVLTLTNAVLATAALSAHLFPADAGRISLRRLALSTGLLNLALAPLGALPMCHGAGGLAAQHRFGARTGLAPAIFGLTCLALGLMLGGGAVAALSIIPATVLGALLSVAGGELAMTKRLFDGRPSCLVVILVTGIASLFGNVAIGLIVGLCAETVRSIIIRRSQSI